MIDPTYPTLPKAEAAAFKKLRALGRGWTVAIEHAPGQFAGPFSLNCQRKSA